MSSTRYLIAKFNSDNSTELNPSANKDESLKLSMPTLNRATKTYEGLFLGSELSTTVLRSANQFVGRQMKENVYFEYLAIAAKKIGSRFHK